MDIQIPKSQREGVRLLISLETSLRAELAELLKDAQPAPTFIDLASRLAKRIKVPRRHLREMLIVIGSLAVVSEDMSKSHAELAASLVDRILEDEELSHAVPEGVSWDRLRDDITLLLDNGTAAAVTRAALGAFQKLEKRYCPSNSTIVSDLRPVFFPDFAAKPAGLLVVHTLKVAYHVEEGEDREFFVSLDSEDLEQLRESIDRAIEVQEALRSAAPNTPYGIIREDGEDE